MLHSYKWIAGIRPQLNLSLWKAREPTLICWFCHAIGTPFKVSASNRKFNESPSPPIHLASGTAIVRNLHWYPDLQNDLAGNSRPFGKADAFIAASSNSDVTVEHERTSIFLLLNSAGLTSTLTNTACRIALAWLRMWRVPFTSSYLPGKFACG